MRRPQRVDLGRNAVLAMALLLATQGNADAPRLLPPLTSDPAAVDEMKRLVLTSRSVGVRHIVQGRVRARYRTRKPCALLTKLGEFSKELPANWVPPLASALQIDRLKSVTDSLGEPCRGDTSRSDMISLTFVQGVDTVRVNLDLPFWYCAWLRSDRLLGISELSSRSAEVLRVMAEALPEDSLLTAVVPCDSVLAAHINAQPGRSLAHGAYVYAEELPEATKRVPPAYPAGARFSGVSGTVMVQALISKTGEVVETVIVRSIPKLDQAAVKAVEQWRFKPARVRGEPMSVWVAIPVKFNLR